MLLENSPSCPGRWAFPDPHPPSLALTPGVPSQVFWASPFVLAPFLQDITTVISVSWSPDFLPLCLPTPFFSSDLLPETSSSLSCPIPLGPLSMAFPRKQAPHYASGALRTVVSPASPPLPYPSPQICHGGALNCWTWALAHMWHHPFLDAPCQGSSKAHALCWPRCLLLRETL